MLGRLTITARIALGSLLVALVIGAVAVVAVRAGVAGILHSSTLTLLQHDAEPFVQGIEHRPTPVLASPGGGQKVTVVGPSGRVRLSTFPAALRPEARRLAAEDPGTVSRVVSAARGDYLVRFQTVHSDAGDWRVITARNRETADLILDRLSLALLAGALACVLGFTLASWLLARAALRPVSRLRERAETLEASADEYLPTGQADDELSALAGTLNDLLARLRASALRERQLVSDASHELRTPLAVLRGELELAQLDAGDADALLADVRAAHASTLRLTDITLGLLELSRLDAGAEPGRAGWEELRTELAEAVDRARALAPDGVLVDFTLGLPPGDDGARVALAAHDLGRILDNLLANAVRVLDGAGGGTVTARLGAEGDGLLLAVADDGPGMPAEFVPVAFERFTRASEHGGGGLGLAIVAALARGAGGAATLENGDGGGLTVRVVLPFLRGPGERVAEPEDL